VRDRNGSRERMETHNINCSSLRPVRLLSGVSSPIFVWYLRSKTVSRERELRGVRSLMRMLPPSPAHARRTHSQLLVLWQVEAS
jgi:hypothetical protein